MSISGAIAKGSGTFVIDRPLNPKNKLLYHSFVESPEPINVYDGIAAIGPAGMATVTLPAYFGALNFNAQYQVSPIDRPMPGLFIAEPIEGNAFVIAGGEPGGEVSWQVTATRKDAFILADPIIAEVDKSDSALVAAGAYVHPDVRPHLPSVRLTQWLRTRMCEAIAPR